MPTIEHEHFGLLMREIADLRQHVSVEIGNLRTEVHEYRREDKSDRVSLATEVSDLQAWKNKQAGMVALVSMGITTFGVAAFQLVGWLLRVVRGSNT